MRVLVVTIVHVPTDARIHHRQIRALADAGHEVVYAAPYADYGLPVAPLPGVTTALEVPRARGRSRLPAVRAARRLIRERAADVDVAVVHDPDLLAAVWPRPGLPVVWDVHEDLAASLTDRAWVPGLARPPVRVLARVAERWAERRLAGLLLAEESYRRRFTTEHPVIPNYPWLPPSPASSGDDRVVYLGRVSALRGARDLVRLADALAPDGVGVDVIGPVDADVRPELEAAHQRGSLRLFGYVPNRQALDLLEGALAGISPLHDHPNYRHSLPTKVLEYQAHGIPVLTTPLPEAVRVVEATGGGVVVAFGAVEAWRDVIVGLRDEPATRLRLAAAGRRGAEQRFSFERVAPSFVEAVERAAVG